MPPSGGKTLTLSQPESGVERGTATPTPPPRAAKSLIMVGNREGDLGRSSKEGQPSPPPFLGEGGDRTSFSQGAWPGRELGPTRNRHSTP